MDMSSSSRFNVENPRLPSPIPPLNRSQHYRGLISLQNSYDSNHGHSNYSNMTSSLASSSKIIPIFSNLPRQRDTDVHSYDSGIGTMIQRTIPERRSQSKGNNPGNTQLPVHHTSVKGTQEGLLFPKYFIDSSSKCIMCKACGIFFNHDIFLRHLHDSYGKRVECYGQCIELALDVPSKEQILTFQEFLAKLARGQNNMLDTRELQQQASRSPARNSMLKTPSNLNSAPANTWTQDIQETVLASEKLLKETSDYLRTSARKMQHRRKNSIQLKELPSLTKDNDTKQTLSVSDKPNESVPVIKNQNQHRTSKRSLQNIFLTEQSGKKDDMKLSSSKLSKPKSDLARPKVVKNITQVTTTPVNENTPSVAASSPNPAMSKHLIDSLPEEQHLDPIKPYDGCGDATSRDVVNRSGEGDEGKMTTDELATSQRREFVPTSQDKKNDPVYILQTAQDLINLATQRIHQHQPKQGSPDNDWYSRYQAEHILRLKCEASIAELKGLLAEEQKQRRELEIQLRAMRLQRS